MEEIKVGFTVFPVTYSENVHSAFSYCTPSLPEVLYLEHEEILQNKLKVLSDTNLKVDLSKAVSSSVIITGPLLYYQLNVGKINQVHFMSLHPSLYFLNFHYETTFQQ